MQSQYSDRPPKQQRSPWFYVLWGCGGCTCLSVVVAIIGVMFVGSKVKQGIKDLATMARAAKVDLKVHDHKMVNKDGQRYIVGSLKNISPSHTYSSAAIEFNVFDKSGLPLTSVSAETHDLKPGATWEFKAPVTDPTATDYKFREVTGFQDLPEDPTLDPATRQKMKEQRAAIDRVMRDMMKKTEDEAAKQGKQ